MCNLERVINFQWRKHQNAIGHSRDQISGYIRSLPRYIAAGGAVLLPLDSLQAGQAVFYLLQKHLLSWQYIHTCYCVHFLNTYKTLGSGCALLGSSTVCCKVANNLVTTLIHSLRMNDHNTDLASRTAGSVSAIDPYFRLREGVCWQSLVTLVAVGYRRSAAPFHMAGPCIPPPEIPGIRHSPCKVFTKYCSAVLCINMYTLTEAVYRVNCSLVHNRYSDQEACKMFV